MALTNLAEKNAPIPTRDDETEFVFLVSNNCQVGVHNTHLFALNLRSLAFTTSVLCMRDVLSVVPTYRCKAIVSSGRGCRRLRTKSSILMSSRDWYSRLASVQIAGQSVSQPIGGSCFSLSGVVISKVTSTLSMELVWPSRR